MLGWWRKERRQQGKNRIKGLEERGKMGAYLEGSRQSSQTGSDFDLKRTRRGSLGYSAGNVKPLNICE